MSEPIFAALEHELGLVIHHGKLEITDDIKRVWQQLVTHVRPEPYAFPDNPKETTVSIFTDEAKTWLADAEKHIPAILDTGEHVAAALDRFTSEPLVEDLLMVLETVPQARAIIGPVLAGVRLIPVPAATPPAPADLAVPVEAQPSDPQIQTGVAQ